MVVWSLVIKIDNDLDTQLLKTTQVREMSKDLELTRFNNG